MKRNRVLRVVLLLDCRKPGKGGWRVGVAHPVRTFHFEPLVIQREVGDRWGSSISLGHLRLLAVEHGEPVRTTNAFRESLLLRSASAVWDDITASLADIGVLAAAREPAERAARLFGAADAMWQDTGRLVTPQLPERGVFERAEARAWTALGADAYAEAEAAGRTLSHEQAVAKAAGPTWRIEESSKKFSPRID